MHLPPRSHRAWWTLATRNPQPGSRRYAATDCQPDPACHRRSEEYADRNISDHARNYPWRWTATGYADRAAVWHPWSDAPTQLLSAAFSILALLINTMTNNW